MLPGYFPLTELKEECLFLGSCSPSSTLLNRFNTNKARVIYILKTPPAPLCRDAVLQDCFLLFSLHIYIFHEKSTCPGGVQAAILPKEKPALSFPYLIYPLPKKPLRKVGAALLC